MAISWAHARGLYIYIYYNYTNATPIYIRGVRGDQPERAFILFPPRNVHVAAAAAGIDTGLASFVFGARLFTRELGKYYFCPANK